MRPDKLPVTVLTGFLGAGKTTLLNEILRGQHGLRVGVIVNEFGDVGIDGDLVLQSEDGLIELKGGCICCTVRTDLLEAVGRLMTQQPPVEYVLVETTGLADPAPIAQTFMSHGVVDVCRLDSIITVVDAYHFDRNLNADPAARSQLEFGDLILLNKTDLVSADRLGEIEAAIRALNPDCRLIRTVNGKADLALILGVGAFDPDRLLFADEHQHEQEHVCGPECDHDHDHHHDQGHAHIHAPAEGHLSGISSVFFTSQRPFDAERLNEYLVRLPVNILRGKGILYVAEIPDVRVVMHQVGDRHGYEPGAPWENDVPESRLVFIGKELDAAAILRELEACLIG